MKPIRRILIIGYCSLLLGTTMATSYMFPWSIDPQGDQSFQQASRSFYEKAYSRDSQSGKDDVYKESAERATLISKTPKLVADFVERYGLKDKKVLEVGAGSGQLQDIVADYTALEISRSARRFFHKPFVEAPATNMPFPDNTFDAIWSFRVLEHIPNPERALLEMRRVVKPGGYILLHVANDVDRYAAQGHRVRPYSDFDIWDRLKKTTISIADSNAFSICMRARSACSAHWGLGFRRDPRAFTSSNWMPTTISIGLAIATPAFQFRTTKYCFGSLPGAIVVTTARVNGI